MNQLGTLRICILINTPSRDVIGNECASWASKITSLPPPSPLSGPIEQNHVKTLEKGAMLQLLMFLESLVICSTMNKTLMVGNEDGIRARMHSGCI